jgi:hypothetical protein
LSETFRDGLLGEFDLAHVEITDAGDFVARMDDRGCAATTEVEVSPPSLFDPLSSALFVWFNSHQAMIEPIV